MIYCEFYVELFYIHSEHTQLSTAGAQYIVSGSWKHKLSFHACKGNRKWTKYWNFRCWCHVQIFRYMNSIYFILIFHYAAFKLPTYFHFPYPIKSFYIQEWLYFVLLNAYFIFCWIWISIILSILIQKCYGLPKKDAFVARDQNEGNIIIS